MEGPARARRGGESAKISSSRPRVFSASSSCSSGSIGIGDSMCGGVRSREGCICSRNKPASSSGSRCRIAWAGAAIASSVSSVGTRLLLYRSSSSFRDYTKTKTDHQYSSSDSLSNAVVAGGSDARTSAGCFSSSATVSSFTGLERGEARGAVGSSSRLASPSIFHGR